jgi:2-methylcitrate dehydratase PrpD
MNAAAIFAEWAYELALTDVPTKVAELAKLRLLDAVGGGLAAFALGQMGSVLGLAEEFGGREEASVIGCAQRFPAPLAALVNGSLIHALDYDDTHLGAGVHSSAVVAPAVLACGEAMHTTCEQALLAAICGYELSARIGMAAGTGFFARGFHPTSVCGGFAAALGAARIRGLSPPTTVSALGIAGSFASGLLEFLADGAQTKPLHAGFAAHAGLVAAGLAAHGAEGPATIFEGRFGLLRSHLGDDFDAEVLTAGLGERFETLEIAVKPYPACSLTHTCLDALAALMREARVSANDVASLSCRVHGDEAREMVLEPIERKRRPATAYEAKFSLPFCLASLLASGRLDVRSFTPASIADPQVLGLAEQIRYSVEPFVGGNESSGSVSIETRDGRRLERTVIQARGGSGHPLSDGEICEKFRANAALALPHQLVDQVLSGLLGSGQDGLEEVMAPLREARRFSGAELPEFRTKWADRGDSEPKTECSSHSRSPEAKIL